MPGTISQGSSKVNERELAAPITTRPSYSFWANRSPRALTIPGGGNRVTAFSVSGAALDSRTIPESYIFLREVGRIAYGLQFENTAQLAAQISPQRPVVLLENDGVLVCGTGILDAFDRLEVLESTAEALINAGHLGPITPMSDVVIHELTNAFLK